MATDKVTYTVVVRRSGANGLDANGAIINTCGHKHTAYDAASNCQDKIRFAANASFPFVEASDGHVVDMWTESKKLQQPIDWQATKRAMARELRYIKGR